jgi:hypothetical protein
MHSEEEFDPRLELSPFGVTLCLHPCLSVCLSVFLYLLHSLTICSLLSLSPSYFLSLRRSGKNTIGYEDMVAYAEETGTLSCYDILFNWGDFINVLYCN